MSYFEDNSSQGVEGVESAIYIYYLFQILI